jgi:hypothetical protein
MITLAFFESEPILTQVGASAKPTERVERLRSFLFAHILFDLDSFQGYTVTNRLLFGKQMQGKEI